MRCRNCNEKINPNDPTETIYIAVVDSWYCVSCSLRMKTIFNDFARLCEYPNNKAPLTVKVNEEKDFFYI